MGPRLVFSHLSLQDCLLWDPTDKVGWRLQNKAADWLYNNPANQEGTHAASVTRLWGISSLNTISRLVNLLHYFFFLSFFILFLIIVHLFWTLHSLVGTYILYIVECMASKVDLKNVCGEKNGQKLNKRCKNCGSVGFCEEEKKQTVNLKIFQS